MVLKINTQLVVGERFDQDFFLIPNSMPELTTKFGLHLFVYPDRPFIFGLVTFGLTTTMSNGVTIFRLFIHLFWAS